MNGTVGILVCGDNHFIVDGPQPDSETARALAHHWSFIEIGGETPAALKNWTIKTREFRENLTWALIVPGEGEMSPAVSRLLADLRDRGISVYDLRPDQPSTEPSSLSKPAISTIIP
ncbi:MAG TPA: hypothetical protein VNX18_17920 [Bryobacteraceae bacterium]|jgi:hypothetical protein|nr:hypothetical protein [Bryobacteraceae bacterium]